MSKITPNGTFHYSIVSFNSNIISCWEAEGLCKAYSSKASFNSSQNNPIYKTLGIKINNGGGYLRAATSFCESTNFTGIAPFQIKFLVSISISVIPKKLFNNNT